MATYCRLPVLHRENCPGVVYVTPSPASGLCRGPPPGEPRVDRRVAFVLSPAAAAAAYTIEVAALVEYVTRVNPRHALHSVHHSRFLASPTQLHVEGGRPPWLRASAREAMLSMDACNDTTWESVLCSVAVTHTAAVTAE